MHHDRSDRTELLSLGDRTEPLSLESESESRLTSPFF